MTRFLRLSVAVATLLVASAAARAHQYQLGAITIQHPHARATVPGQPTGGAFMVLVNKGAADRLLGISADVARSAELHEMKMENDVMKMRQVDAIDVGAGQTVELKPGGYHVMFVGLKAPLKAGERFPMKLKFEKAGEVTVDVTIDAPGAAMGASGTMQH